MPFIYYFLSKTKKKYSNQIKEMKKKTRRIMSPFLQIVQSEINLKKNISNNFNENWLNGRKNREHIWTIANKIYYILFIQQNLAHQSVCVCLCVRKSKWQNSIQIKTRKIIIHVIYRATETSNKKKKREEEMLFMLLLPSAHHQQSAGKQADEVK